MEKAIGVIGLLLLLVGFSGFRLIQLEELRVDYMNYFPGGRDPLIRTQSGYTCTCIGVGGLLVL